MEGRNIKLLVAYDGTDFHGWQRQVLRSRDQGNGERVSDETRTVQETIENALLKIHGHHAPLTGSGRTDAGVHAAGQVANFFTDIKSIPEDRFTRALNSILPQDIRILESSETEQNFHARYSARMRIYRYYFICRRHALPHESRYNLQLWRFPCLERLNAYGRLLLGETDCAIFAGAGDSSLLQGKSTNRYIYFSRFFIEGDKLVFEICANAFMRKMVRSIAGTFLFYEEKNTPIKKMREIILSKERSLAGPTLPPQGLFLWKVEF